MKVGDGEIRLASGSGPTDKWGATRWGGQPDGGGPMGSGCYLLIRQVLLVR